MISIDFTSKAVASSSYNKVHMICNTLALAIGNIRVFVVFSFSIIYDIEIRICWLISKQTSMISLCSIRSISARSSPCIHLAMNFTHRIISPLFFNNINLTIPLITGLGSSRKISIFLNFFFDFRFYSLTEESDTDCHLVFIQFTMTTRIYFQR